MKYQTDRSTGRSGCDSPHPNCIDVGGGLWLTFSAFILVSSYIRVDSDAGVCHPRAFGNNFLANFQSRVDLDYGSGYVSARLDFNSFSFLAALTKEFTGQIIERGIGGPQPANLTLQRV
jgi:hypothetical protein